MTHIRDFFSLPPSNKDHHPALRCAIGVGIPLLTLLAIGRTDLAIFAVIGAFTGVYGRGLAHRPRFSQQWRASLLLLAALMAGLTASHLGFTPGILVGCAAVVGAIGFLGTAFGRLKPSGSLFFVFAFSTIAFMQTPPPFAQALLTAVAAALLSLVIGVAGRMLPGHHTPWVREPRVFLSSEERREAYVQAGMHLAGIALSGALAIQVGFGHSYWAMMAATAALVGATAAHRIARGLHRIIGASAGLVLAGLILSLHPRAWQMILIVLVLQFLVELFITRHYALAQTFVTPLALLMTEVALPTSPWTLIVDRGVETLLGAGVGMVLVIFMHGVRALRIEQAAEE